MRVVELPNHPGDMLCSAARRRRAAEQRVLSVYEDELIRYRARVQAVRVRRDRARGLFAIEVKNLNASAATTRSTASAGAPARAGPGSLGHRVDEP